MENITSLQELTDFTKSEIIETTALELFKDIDDGEKIKEILEGNFDEIYLVQINPWETEKYKDNKEIAEIIEHYKGFIDNHPLNILILRWNGVISAEVLAKYEEMKVIYGDMIQLDSSKYRVIIGCFGGTTGRTNQLLIDKIQSEYSVKILK